MRRDKPRAESRDRRARRRRAAVRRSYRVRLIKTIAARLYGVYALFAMGSCMLVCGLTLFLIPDIARRRRFARRGVRLCFRLTGLRIATAGMAHIPATPCIVIANHRSYFDGLALIAALPGRFTPLIKSEIARIPGVAAVLRRAGCRFVRRRPATAAGRDTVAMLTGLKNGESLAMFPEGTFSVDDGTLPFRDGAFFLAGKTGVPVVPVTIDGTEDVLPLHSVLPRYGRIRIAAEPAITATGALRADAHLLRGQAESVVWNNLRHARAEPEHESPGAQYYASVFAGRRPPFAYIDLDLQRAAIRAVLARTGGKRVRADADVLGHPVIADRVVRSGVRFSGVACSDPPQAIRLAREWKVRDVLVPTPIDDPNVLRHVVRAVRGGAALTLSAANTAHVAAVAAAAVRARTRVWLCLCLTPTSSDAAERALIEAVACHPRLRWRGVVERTGSALDASALAQWREHWRWQLRTVDPARRLFNVADESRIALDSRDRAVTDITVGRGFFAHAPEPMPAWPVAGYALASSEAGRGERATDALAEAPGCDGVTYYPAADGAALCACFQRFYLVQGGAVIAQIDNRIKNLAQLARTRLREI